MRPWRENRRFARRGHCIVSMTCPGCPGISLQELRAETLGGGQNAGAEMIGANSISPRRCPLEPGEARRGDRRAGHGVEARARHGVVAPWVERKLGEAIAAFQAEIRLRPEDAATHFLLGAAFEARGKAD